MSEHAPVFVLCMARSGSTLLRRLLDAHSKIWAPGEMHLGEFVADLMNVIREASMRQWKRRDRLDLVRETLDGLMQRFLRQRGKLVWCDKSDAIHHVDVFSALYPSARFICLYRHALDTTASNIEVFQRPEGTDGRYGLPSWLCGYGDVRARSGIEEVLNAWVGTTDKALRAEADANLATMRVRYEDLVVATQETMAAIFRFLDLEVEDTEQTALQREPALRRGKGDHKIHDTRCVGAWSLGTGRSLPWQQVNPRILSEVNARLAPLGYPELDAKDPSYDVGVAMSPAPRLLAPEEITAAIDQLLSRTDVRLDSDVMIYCAAQRMLITHRQGRPELVELVPDSARAPAELTLTRATMSEILCGRLTAHTALRQHRVLYEGDPRTLDALMNML